MVHQALKHRIDKNGVTHWMPEGHVLSWIALVALSVLLALGFFFFSGQENGVGIEAAVTASLRQGLQALMPALPATDLDTAIGMLAAFFPGTVGASWLAMLVINAMLAQNILVRMGRNIRPAIDYDRLELPGWASWALVAAAVIALVGTGDVEYIGQNGAMVLVVPFFFLGLAVAHFLANRTAFPGTAVTTIYIAMLFSRWALLAVAGLGIIEQWVGIRRQFQGPKNGQED